MPVPKRFDSSIPVEAAPAKFGDDVPIDTGEPTATAEPPQPGAISRFLSSAGGVISGAVKGLDPRPTDEEKKQGLTSPYDYVMRPFERVTESHIDQGKKAIEAAKKGDKSLAAGHGLAAILPVVGPVAASAGEEIGTQVGEGNYAGAAGTAAGNLALVEAPKAIKSLPKIGRGFSEAATGTSPHTVADLVKKTAEENKIGEGKARAAREVEAKRSDLTGKINDTSRELQGRIETARNNALKIGNEKYSGVNEAIGHIEADPEFLPDAISQATETLRGSKAEPTLLRSIEKIVERGDVPTYSDLQGDYSQLGAELSKGNLPGDVYKAYDALHEAIGNEMQRIADEQGQGEALKDARNYWRRMKQTFGRPAMVRDAATKTLHSLSPEFAKEQTTQNRVRLLSHYDPEIERGANEVTEARQGLKSLPKTKPGATEFQPKKIGSEDIREAKTKSLEDRTNMIRRRGQWIATGAAGYQLLSNVLHGELKKIPGNIIEGAGALTGVAGIAKLLENPKVVEMLTRPTERDIAEIPPEMRGDLQQIAQIASQRGIKVSPLLYAAVSVRQPRKRVAAALTQ